MPAEEALVVDTNILTVLLALGGMKAVWGCTLKISGEVVLTLTDSNRYQNGKSPQISSKKNFDWRHFS